MKRHFHVVLFEPEIAGNVGAIIRNCVALNIELHLIKPFGFFWDQRFIKRSSANYMHHLKFYQYDDLNSFISYLQTQKHKIFYLTAYSRKIYSDVDFTQIDAEENLYFMFGKESTGIPIKLLQQNKNKCLRIPMSNKVRSLNVANTVSIVLYEVMRQFNFPKLLKHDSCKNSDYW